MCMNYVMATKCSLNFSNFPLSQTPHKGKKKWKKKNNETCRKIRIFNLVVLLFWNWNHKFLLHLPVSHQPPVTIELPYCCVSMFETTCIIASYIYVTKIICISWYAYRLQWATGNADGIPTSGMKRKPKKIGHLYFCWQYRTNVNLRQATSCDFYFLSAHLIHSLQL